MLLILTSTISEQIKKRSAITEAFRRNFNYLKFTKSPNWMSSAPKERGEKWKIA